MTEPRSPSRFASGARICALLVAVASASCSGGGDGTPAPAAVTPPPTSASLTPAGGPPPATPPPVTPPPASTAPNSNPVLVKAIPDQRGQGQRPFSFDLSQGGTTFTDPDGDRLNYYAVVYGQGIAATGPMLNGTLPASGTISIDVLVQDGRNGSANDHFSISIVPNAAPEATRPNLVVMTSPGLYVDYDPTKSGTTFGDADNDPLTYELKLISPPRGLAIDGTRVLGTLDEVGAVTFELTATDIIGAQGKDRFSVVIAAPEPGAPALPSKSFAYADAELSLPPLKGMEWDSTPNDNRTTNAGATLGRVLFYDKRLSVTNTHSCGSCHEQAHGFATAERFPVGVQGVPLKRHAMALSNVRFNYMQRWFSDLRAGSLEELALMPIQEPSELGNYLPVLEEKLAATSFYPPLFEAAFGTREVTSDRIARALAQFLRSLMSYRSRYDAAYGREMYREDLLTAEELRGREIFRDNTRPMCGRCHLSDLQLMLEPKGNGLDGMITDPGVIDPTGKPTGWFRAPSLRNITASAPYMHDGRFATLREVIDHYDHGIQFGIPLDLDLRVALNGPAKQFNLSEEEKAAIETFLRALTDDAFLNDPKLADPFPR